MIPKSGFRFSEKIMRKKASTKPREAERRKAQSVREPCGAQTSVRSLRHSSAARQRSLRSLRSPSGAPLRLSLRRANATAQLRAMLPGTSLRRQASRRKPIPVKRSTPHPGRNAGGNDARAAPARSASPRGSTAPAPHFGSHPECVPRTSEQGSCNTIGD